MVNIRVKGETEVDEDDVLVPGLPDLPEDNRLYKFFKEFKKLYGQDQPNGKQNPAKSYPMMAQGSGSFISPDGYLVTNNHVLEDATYISITLENGDELPQP